MVKKVQEDDTEAGPPPPFSQAFKASANQIWLAGLGAFAKAQEEGGKVFEALVRDGINLQRRAQSSAGDRISEATGKMASLAAEITSRASGKWDKLEDIFDERVARSMSRLGAPSAEEFAELAARVDHLEREIVHLGGKAAPAGASGAARTPAKRAPRRSA